MKQSEDILNGINDKIFIGNDVGDKFKNDKEIICNKLSHHFLKKINLIASIQIISKKCFERLNNLSDGNQCYNSDNIISNIDYKPFYIEISDINFNDNKNYKFQDNEKLQFDKTDIRNLTFERLKSDKRGEELLKNNQYNLQEMGKKKLLFREIFDKNECITNNGKWLTSKKELLDNNLIPNKEISSYNTLFDKTINNSKKILSDISFKLLDLIKKIIDEKQINENENKIYIDKSITDIKLKEYSNDIKTYLSQMMAEVEKTYILISNIIIINKKELEKKKKISNELDELNIKMKKTQILLDKSNV